MKNFNVEKAVKDNVNFLRRWFNQFGADSIAVIGISGGKDSTIAAALLVKAIGKERVLGIMMPNGRQTDIEDSKKVCQMLDIRNDVAQIGELYGNAISMLGTMSSAELTSQLIINLAPRLRMMTLYGVAQGQKGPAFVINTCNRSEDYVGYSTKYGDAAGDVAVLQDFLVEEVLEIGDYLGLPYKLVHKTPSDGLCGRTDEDNLGFTYAQLDNYLKWKEEEVGECPIASELAKIIEKKHTANLHKLEPIPSCMRC